MAVLAVAVGKATQVVLELQGREITAVTRMAVQAGAVVAVLVLLGLALQELQVALVVSDFLVQLQEQQFLEVAVAVVPDRVQVVLVATVAVVLVVQLVLEAELLIQAVVQVVLEVQVQEMAVQP
jgi:hypothetical protein